MKLELKSNAIVELQTALSEADRLSSRILNKQEEQRLTFLLSKISLLKQGVSSTEIAKADAERICRDSGIAYVPKPVNDSVEREWRDFLDGSDKTRTYAPVRFEIRPEVRAQVAGSQTDTYTAGTAGGYFVPFGFHPRAIATMKQYDEIFDDRFCQVLESETGNPVAYPILDDIGQKSVLVSENTKGSPRDFFAGQRQLGAYSFRSGLIYTTFELLQDSGLPIGALLEFALAVRHARGAGQAMITGSGVGQPTGLLTAALAAGATVVTAAGSSANDGSSNTGANSIGTPDLVKLFGSLDRACRRRCCWYMSDDTLINHIMSLVDKMGRPILQLVKGAMEDDGECYYLMGRPVAVCPSMADVGPSQDTVILADPTYFVQRRITAGSYLRRSVQVVGAAENAAVAWQSWYRTDSNLLVGNNNVPAAILQMHS